MRGRLRRGAGLLLTRLRLALARPRPSPAPPGRARNVIVVKPRDPRFQEVIYVLRDELFSQADCSREELLRQAGEAARAETGSVLPSGRRPVLWPAVLLLLGTALILKLCGLW